jgi:hypothetical protein
MRLWPLVLAVLGCGSAETPGAPAGASGFGPGGNGTTAGAAGSGAAPTNSGGTAHGGGGSATGAGGAGGTGGTVTMVTLKQPIDRGTGRLVLELGSTYFEVEPGHGGRITSLRHAGQELLTLIGSANYLDAVGSTFWPSPQTWPWPPPSEIDSGAYQATVDPSGVISLVGQPNEATRLRVSKRFAANLTHESVDIEYSMTNVGLEPVSWAPWEITRMPATGLAFWPTGGAPFGELPLQVTTAAGHTWCEPKQTEGEAKLFADGAGGYLAYLLGDRLLLKRFQDLPASAAAPGEAEIELYVNPDHDYVEVEHQGAYTSIAPGATVTWKVSWYVRQLPSGVSLSPGSSDLVAFVTKTLE